MAEPREEKFLGFSFTSGESPRRRRASKAIKRFKERVLERTDRRRGISLERMAKRLAVDLWG